MNIKTFCILALHGVMAPILFAAVDLKEAEITTVKNMVEHDDGSGAGAAPAKASDKIHEKSKVNTAAASMAELTFADSTISRLGANSSFSFQSKERLVKLDKGSVLVNTPPGNGGATVDCGGVTAAVTGTTFMASRDNSGNVMFVMLEGSGVMKITVPTAEGGVLVKEIRPGQAASVGGAAVAPAKEDGSDSPGSDNPKSKTSGGPKEEGGGDKSSGEKPEPSNAGGDKPAPADRPPEKAADKPAAPAKAPAIQVFDVDVKKIVETTPLIREFRTELPSMEKINKTVEVQQTAVKEGKMEKLEVEIVAVQKDGDVLVGAPRVDKGDFVVVNKKEEPKPIINNNGPRNPDNVDIETAAGPGAGPSPAPAPTTTAQAAGVGAPPAAPQAPAPVLNPVGSAIISQTVAGAGGTQPNPTMTGRAPAGTVVIGDPVNPLVITLSGPMKVTGTGTLTLTFNGVTVSKAISVTAGSTTFSILGSDLPDPKVYSVGSVAQAQVTLSLTGALGTVTQTITLDSRPVSDPVVLAASPIRKLLDLSKLGPTELAGLDAYFYFQSKAPGNNLPTEFFSGSSVKSLSGFPASVGNTIELYPGQTFDFYAAGTVNAGLGDFNLAPTSGRDQVMIFGKRVDWGDAAATWAGLQDPLQDPNSLGYLAVANNNSYLPVYDNQNGGFFDSFDTLNLPLANFPVWDDAAGTLGSSTSLSLAPGINKFALVAGLDGMRIRGLDLNASGATVGLWSGADLQLQAVDLRNVGPGGSTSGGLSVDAVGKVKMGADASLNLDLPTQAGVAEAQQVRLEGQTGVNALGVSAPLPGNLAVIRTGDSLELRNLTIRNFSETRLEGYAKDASGSSVLQGRILLSGSSVRDFKIKELVGAAVNSDAKIQMMAVDDAGALSGELTVAGKMPVAGKLAQAMDSSITGTLGNTKVDAVQVDLAAKRINFQAAQLTAMNAITARAQTILMQDSFMTVVRDRGMINMFVREGLVNTTYGTLADGKLNFNGSNTFQIGNNSFSIRNQADLTAAYGNSLVDITHNGGSPQPGKVNVLKL